MAKKPQAGKAQQEALLSESNIEQVENETIDRVNKTVTVLEGALATWEASKEKPKRLEEKFARYKKFLGALTEWETKALKARGTEESFDSRVLRLRGFIDICYSYA